jgi:hypothetical protein
MGGCSRPRNPRETESMIVGQALRLPHTPLATGAVALQSNERVCFLRIPYELIATYKLFLAPVRKAAFEKLDRYGLDPKRDRSLDAQRKCILRQAL